MDEIKDIDIGKITEIAIDNEAFKECLSDVSKIDDFRDYLRETMAMDIKRFFNTPKEQQDLVKGAFYRTQYLYQLLKKISDKEIEKQ
jgi:GTP1/Obg family GTP-binding protein